MRPQVLLEFFSIRAECFRQHRNLRLPRFPLKAGQHLPDQIRQYHIRCGRTEDAHHELPDWIIPFRRAFCHSRIDDGENRPYSRVHVLKSLIYFEDAERAPMPHMLVPLDWHAVTAFFTTEIPRLS